MKSQFVKIFFPFLIFIVSFSCDKQNDWVKQTEEVLHELIIKNAEWAMSQEPQTVTSFVCDRSAGTINDFYSEGDYWWPNPDDPEGPYIRKDGETNPDNFVEHRLAMIRFSQVVGSLASAYLVTNNEDYVIHAFKHINAWFSNPETMMNPNLLYAQAIKGVTEGRGIGIIDTIHLMEVAQGIICMEEAACVDKKDLDAAKKWFAEYLQWLTTHQYGLDELNAKNNHGTCWVMQVASFAKLADDKNKLEFCKTRYKNILLPKQMGKDGSFPLETARTKPYGYSLFNLDAMATICQILSTPQDDLWNYSSSQGLSIKLGVEYIYPYIKDKSKWPFEEDVMYWNDWPVAQPSLLFAAQAYDNTDYFELWKSLDHNPSVSEVVRNMPIRNPLIWIVNK